MKLRLVNFKVPSQKIVLVTERGCRAVVEYAPSPTRHKVMHFDTLAEVELPDLKKLSVIKLGDVVTDYRDVPIKGYLSTFESVTRSDRDGEYIVAGAFTETLKDFKKNPVMLIDHRNQVPNVAGSFTKFVQDKSGLYVEGMLSNAPGNIDVRFKVAEGHLRTLSMGGIFHFLQDGRGIFKVDLWEGSVVAVPSNPDALFSVRECTEQEMKRIDFSALPELEMAMK